MFTFHQAVQFANMEPDNLKGILQKRNIHELSEGATESAAVASNPKVIHASLDLSDRMFRPMRPTLVLEDLIREQNYKGMDRDRLNRAIEAMDIQEPI